MRRRGLQFTEERDTTLRYENEASNTPRERRQSSSGRKSSVEDLDETPKRRRNRSRIQSGLLDDSSDEENAQVKNEGKSEGRKEQPKI